MATTYLLPCPCGNKVPVTATQAGLSVRCKCGKELEVPTHRELSRLERGAERQIPGKHVVPQWTPWHGLIFLGLMLLAPALGCAVYLLANQPVDPVIEEIRNESVLKSWERWSGYRQGIRLPSDPVNDALVKQIQAHRFWTRVCWIVAGVGFGMSALGFVMRSRLPRQAATPAQPPGQSKKQGKKRKK